jgi:hypothetical protein
MTALIRLLALVLVLALAAPVASTKQYAAVAQPTSASAAVGADARGVVAVATAQPQREITNDSTVVVLVSFGRSGSTFVASLLESHPLVHFVPGEPWNGSCPPEELRVSRRCRHSGGFAADRASFCGAVRAVQANSTAIDSVSD